MDYEEFEENSFSMLDYVYYIFGNYGWHLLVLSIFLVIIYNKILKSYLEKYKQHKFEREYAAKYHKNPDIFAAHVNAQQSWAEKMQEKYNRANEEYQRKMKEKEEKKRQELMEKYGSSSGHVLGHKKDDTNKPNNLETNNSNKPNNLRPEYNPLMGAGSSSNYRPPRRSPCGGGGCGR